RPSDDVFGMYMPGRFRTAERPSRILICSAPYSPSATSGGRSSSGSSRSCFTSATSEGPRTEPEPRDPPRRVRGEHLREELLGPEPVQLGEQSGAPHLDREDAAAQRV